MAQYAARAINNKVRMSSAQVFFKLDGSEKLFNTGNNQSLVYTPEIQEWEDWSRQHGAKTLVGTYPIQKGATIELSTTSWTELIYKLMYVSEGEYVAQEEIASSVHTFAAVEIGDIYKVPVKNATITTADDGDDVAPIAWVEGTHFTFHKPSGIVEILAIPDTATDLVLDLAAPVIADADKLLKLKIMESQGLTGRLIAIGTNQVGAKGELNVGRVKFLPSAGVASVGGDEGDVAALTGRVYADENGEFGTWEAFEAI